MDAATPERLSISGKRWHLKDDSTRTGLALAQRFGLPELVGRVMANRGVTLENAPTYMEPNLRDLPDPAVLKDMGTALARISRAVEKAETIGIFGDYDVDGSAASALLMRYFRHVGVKTELYIPDRLTEGYGPNPVAMQRLKARGVSLLITVDCGSLAHAAMTEAKKLGIDVIITDHHQTGAALPPCEALVNPNRLDDTSGHGVLAGVGVAFLVAVGLNRTLREQGFFNGNRPEPDLRRLLDLVAVATVCDVVPLTGVNRLLVDRGLKVLGGRTNPGLTALADVAGVNERPGTYHAGFVLGPRINAGGRISACDLGARLLATDDPTEARQLAERLQQLNVERKTIEDAVLRDAMDQAEATFKPDDVSLVVAGEGWHPGVIGIVAARLKERFHRPTFVIALDSTVSKGSGRSISGIDLGRAVMACSDILVAGGGHKMAAGVSLEAHRLDDFRARLADDIRRQADPQPQVFIERVNIDALVRPRGASLELIDTLEKLEPYGMGNPEPRLALTDVRLQGAKLLGDAHVRVTVTDADGARLNAIAFRCMDGPLGPWLLNTGGRAVTVCGQLRRNVWQGVETPQLQLSDGMEGAWPPR
jgi:single-stranded-DNA-specific exonuclease